MNYTTNYNLQKPLSNEKYNIAVANINNDLIDAALKRIDSKNESQDILLATKNEVSSLNSSLSTALNNEITRAKLAEKSNSDNIVAETIRSQEKENEITSILNAEISRAKSVEDSIQTVININKPDWDDKYTKNEIDNKLSTLEMAIDWKESVPTFNEISITYPSPQDGWTVNVNDTDYTYRYSGTEWVVISANAIPKATQVIDGLLSKEDKISYDDANSKKHTHSNKTVLDGITSTLIAAWNSAVTHINDTVKHITSTERTNWNDSDSKKHTHDNKSILDNIGQTLIDNWNDTFNKRHEHSNKSVIDGITSGLISTWNTAKAHADSAHSPSNSERNVIIGVQKNGVDVAIDSNTRKVNIIDDDTKYSLGVAANNSTNGNSKIRLSDSSTNSDVLIKGTGATLVTTDSNGNIVINSTDTNTTYSNATISLSGLMSSTDKSKLDGIASGAKVNIQSDWINTDITSDAFIKNKPTIPSRTSQIENDSGYITTLDVDTSQNHTHPNKVTIDKIVQSDLDKLAGIDAGANKYTLPTATNSVLGGVKSGSNITNSSGTLSITSANIISALGYTPGTSIASECTGNSATATKLAASININGMSVDGTADRSNYGSCSTDAATVAKTVTCTGFILDVGAEITVKFTITNTASSPTLNVNSTGAKPIYYRGEAITTGYLAANRTYTFRYNGTQYDLTGDVDTNIIYTHPTTAGNKHIPSGGASGNILRWYADGTAVWGTESNGSGINYSDSEPTTLSSDMTWIGTA